MILQWRVRFMLCVMAMLLTLAASVPAFAQEPVDADDDIVEDAPAATQSMGEGVFQLDEDYHLIAVDASKVETQAQDLLVPNPADQQQSVEAKQTIYLPLVSLDMNSAAVTSAEAAATNAPWVNLMNESFEGAWPNSSWQVYDVSGAINGEYYWNDVNTAAFSGNWSIWPASGGANAVSPSQSFYPNNANSLAIYGPFSLVNKTKAQFLFRYWNRSELNYDKLRWCVSPNKVNWYCKETTGDSKGWKQGKVDLKKVSGYGSLLGDDNVWVAFHFVSDGSFVSYGPFVDEVLIRAK